MKKIIAKTISYVVPSLLAAGAFAESDTAAPEDVSSLNPSLEKLQDLAADIKKQQTHTLAGHSSHSSHGSHGSHGSHSSHSSYSGTNLIQTDVEAIASSEQLGTSRNESSTPRSTVLPNSPAIVEPKKLKVLPGHSTKFKDTVIKAQIALQARGYNSGALNGELHARTIAAIYEYQSSVGLPATGKLTPDTLSTLGIVAG